MINFNIIWLNFYRLILLLNLPIIIFILLIRILRGKEDQARFFEKLAFTKKKKINNLPLIIINAVSVGEANTAFQLAQEIIKFSDKLQILITTTTITSAKIIEQKTSNNLKIFHQYLPIDVNFVVKKFLNYWQPSAIIFIESDIWPNLIASAKSRSIEVFLVNGRISDKSLKIWQKIQKLGFNIFDCFSTIIAQSQQEKNKLQTLTNNQVLFFGNLKSQINELEFNFVEFENLKKQINNRPVWLCVSTHRGEEKIIIETHQKLKTKFDNLLTIIVLRHPNRANEVVELLRNLKFSIRSKLHLIKNDDEIYLVDTLNELGLFYRLANFAFIGGSLLPIGGHNPYEAIKLNCAVISGNNFSNFFETYQELIDNNAVRIVNDHNQLYEEVVSFLSDKNLSLKITNNALPIFEKYRDCSNKIIAKINETLKLK